MLVLARKPESTHMGEIYKGSYHHNEDELGNNLLTILSPQHSKNGDGIRCMGNGTPPQLFEAVLPLDSDGFDILYIF